MKYDILKNIDHSVSPGTDFYAHVNNKWIAQNPIPPSFSIWGAFRVLDDDVLSSLKDLMVDLSKKNIKDPSLKKLNNFYTAGLSAGKIQKNSIAAIQKEIENIKNIKDRKDLIEVIANFHKKDIGALWNPFVGADDKKSTKNILHFFQGGLGMPDRDYYTKKDERSKKIQNLYLAHIAALIKKYGNMVAMPTDSNKRIVAVEMRLAAASMTQVERRDVEAQYNKMSLKKISALAPNVDWLHYIKLIGVTPQNTREIIVCQPKFIKEVDKLFREISLSDWKLYLTWHLLSDSAHYLSEPLAKERFKFTGTVLSGQKEIKPRWKRVIKEIDGSMGEALGKLYVQKYFPQEAKHKMDILIDDLFTVYRDRIKKLDWMSAVTKKKALRKLARFNRKIGHPQKWKNYAVLKVDKDSYLKSHWGAMEFAFNTMIHKLGRPVDKKEWHTSPPTVNAYYSSNFNEIIFPAGILQPPFFDFRASMAANYGGIGAVIGHEITHGFDDQGSLFDGAGNLKKWWTKKDRERFNKKAAQLVKQYDQCEVLKGMYCNGKFTLGENIADLGGVMIAYEALKRALTRKNTEKDTDGFTPEQQFFISFAHVWAEDKKEEEARKRLITDPHAPGKLRVNVVLSNINEFYNAFNIKPGDTLYRKPHKRVAIW